MVEAIFSFLFEKMLGVFPRWLARRFTSSQKIASQVEIDLRRINPVDISFGSDIPSLRLCFRISNLSSLDLVLDRLLVDLWVGQPTLRGAILVRYDVPRRSSRDDVYFTDQLTLPQQKQIRERINGQLLSVPITIYVEAYFDSKVGLVHVKKTLEHRDIPCK